MQEWSLRMQLKRALILLVFNIGIRNYAGNFRKENK